MNNLYENFNNVNWKEECLVQGSSFQESKVDNINPFWSNKMSTIDKIIMFVACVVIFNLGMACGYYYYMHGVN